MSPSLHRDEPVFITGAPLDRARIAMILMHGRGASAQDILTLGDEFARADVAYLAPQAANQTWYPFRFFEPIEKNEPWLSSALAVIGDLLARIAASGIPAERTVLAGFSQGACLVAEFAARHARRYGGVVALSGALIGPDGVTRPTTGTLDQTQVFLGCGEDDIHIPKERVLATERTLRARGGNVTTRFYSDVRHTIYADEIEFVRAMLEQIE
ncbi:MAG: alpha/beta fold hydrolase [Chloroflexi bacterium]|nr:alpha/beta fold hydrolase [Chloroflexota bacterium]